MSPTPARSAWQGRRLTGGPYVRGPVRGSGPGAVRADDPLVDGEAVRRGCLHRSNYGRLPMASLTLAERVEVVARMASRFASLDDAAIYLGWSIPTLRSYAHWGRTGEWITPNELTRVLAQRAAELHIDESVTTL